MSTTGKPTSPRSEATSEAPQGAMEDATTGLQGVSRTEPLFDNFEDYWQSLIERNPAIASEPSAKIRGLTFHDLKDALREAFDAARATSSK